MTSPWISTADAATANSVFFISASFRLVAVHQFVRRAVGKLDLVHVAVERSVARLHGFDGDLLADDLREVGAREADALVPGRRIALELPLVDLAAITLRVHQQDDVDRKSTRLN